MPTCTYRLFTCFTCLDPIVGYDLASLLVVLSSFALFTLRFLVILRSLTIIWAAPEPRNYCSRANHIFTPISSSIVLVQLLHW